MATASRHQPEFAAALLNRLLPVIQDPLATRADRIQAIRQWRKAGVPIGADTLIGLLCEPGDIPKDEIIRALRRLGHGMGRQTRPLASLARRAPLSHVKAITEQVEPR